MPVEFFRKKDNNWVMEYEYIEAKRMPKPLDGFDRTYFEGVEEWAEELVYRFEEDGKESPPRVLSKIDIEKKEK